MKRFFIVLVMTIFSLTVCAQDKPINNLVDYFEYLPDAVHNNWTPHKANKDYEVTVQFRIYKNGRISHPEIIESSNVNANMSAISAVKSGAPYKPLPDNFKKDYVGAQVQLKYIKSN